MLRALLFAPVALCAAAFAPGCFGSPAAEVDCDLDLDLGIPSQDVKIRDLEERYALGSRARVSLHGGGHVYLESSHPDVVRIDSVRPGEAVLSFVGEGRSTVTAYNEISEAAYEVEVARHASFVVLLTEITDVPLAPLDGQVVVSGVQHMMVLYLDSSSRQLYGDDLADISLSSGLESCDERLGSVDRHCLTTDLGGVHLVTVRVGNDEQRVELETVPAEAVVGIEVLQPDESALLPETWAQIDVVGVTEEGRHVASMHPQFQTDHGLFIGYFSYQYDPDAVPESVEIRALDMTGFATFRGAPSQTTAFGCDGSDQDGGPVRAAGSLLGLVFFIRLASRRRDPSRSPT